jgi:hypothetical protein
LKNNLADKMGGDKLRLLCGPKPRNIGPYSVKSNRIRPNPTFENKKAPANQKSLATTETAQRPTPPKLWRTRIVPAEGQNPPARF